MSEHTKEPWRVECDEWDDCDPSATAWPTIHAGDFEVCGTEGFYSYSRDVDVANARRVVACVNACVGIETDELERVRSNTIVQTAARVMNLDLIQHATSCWPR